MSKLSLSSYSDFNDDRIEFLSLLLPMDFKNMLKTDECITIFTHKEIGFTSECENRLYLYIDCTTKSKFACVHHSRKSKCSICGITGSKVSTDYVSDVKRYLKQKGHEHKSWELVSDWTGWGPDFIKQTISASGSLRRIRSDRRIVLGRRISDEIFATLPIATSGAIVRYFGAHERKPKDRLNSILEGYSNLFARYFEGASERSVFYTVPAALFRQSRCVTEEQTIISCETYFNELGRGEWLLCTTNGGQHYCSGSYYYDELTKRRAPIIVSENWIEYTLDFDKFKSKLTRENKNITDGQIRHRYGDAACNIQRLLHYQQMMRVMRIRDWANTTPLWMAIITLVHLEKMYKNTDYEESIARGVKYRSNWFMSPPLLHDFIRLSKIEDKQEYYKAKDLIKDSFAQLFKWYDPISNDYWVKDTDIKAIHDNVFVRINSGEKLGLKGPAECEVCDSINQTQY